MYHSLQEFIEKLEQEQELIRIQTKVSPILEVSEIVDRISKSSKYNKALLFENTGTNFPILINAFGSEKRIALALGYLHIEQIAIYLERKIEELLSLPQQSLLKKILSLPKLKRLINIRPRILKNKKAPAQEVIIKDPNINILPILKTWPLDAERFITLPIVHTKDPITGIRNVGMYRMQIIDEKTTAMHWHKHKGGAAHFAQYKKIEQKMPVAVALGGDPVYTYVATAPLPENIDEYLLAGIIRKKPVELVKCITQDIEVPADADIVIEGYIDPSEPLVKEGPFGDHTGFYSEVDYYPAFHITCITHRKNAIYPATLVGIPPQEDFYISKTTERIFLPIIRSSIVPELIDMDMPAAGVSHNFTILKIKKSYEGQANKVMSSMWGAGQMMFNKFMFIVSEEIMDIHNYQKLASEAFKNYNPLTDTTFFKGPLDVLDHSTDKTGLGSKIGIDLTKKIGIEEKTYASKLTFEKYLFDKIKAEFPEIKEININLLKNDIPVIIISIQKKEKIKLTAQRLIENFNLEGIKIILWIDSEFNPNDIYYSLWLIGNNTNPIRDAAILTSQKYQYNILSIDGTKKTKDIDNYQKKWPQIIVMDKKTIEQVDNNWYKYGFNEFIKSPSLRFIK